MADDERHATQAEEHEAPSRRRGCCGCCSGFRRIHSMEAAGGSHWAPWWLMVVVRLLAAGVSLMLAVWCVVYETVGLYLLTAACFGTFISFTLLAVCAALCESKSKARGLPTAAVVLHAFAITWCAYSLPAMVTIGVRRFYGPAAWLIFIPIGFFLLDTLVLQARFEWVCVYGVPTLVLFELGNITLLVLNGTQIYPGVIGFFVLYLFLRLVMLFTLVGLTQNRKCFRGRERQRSEV